jgi:hypothetical protein
MSRNTKLLMATALVLVCSGAAFTQDTTRPAPCSSSEYRQFDFWLGKWKVTDKDGKLLGHNEITSILGGCALEENWASAGGGNIGTSYNIYDRGRKVWHQTWVDGSGLLLTIEGGIRDGSMVLEGLSQGPKGEARQRITWTPLPDGRVRQLWETAPAGGDFKTAFEGFYARR